MKALHEIDSVRAAVLFGISVGLGITVHPAFLLVAAAIAIGALTTVVVHAIHRHGDHTWLTHGMD
jgi:hypothetical protein